MNSSKHLTLVSALLAGTLSLTAQDRWTDGHGDIGVGLESNALHLHAHLHDGSIVNGVALTDDEEYDAGDLIIEVPADVELTASGNIPELGLSSGDNYWILTDSDQPFAMPFLGLAAEELTDTDWNGGITFSLGTVTSPSGNGNFAVRQFNSLSGMEYYFASLGDSFTENNNQLTLSIGAHAHYDWLFTETGTWSVELTASGDHITLGSLSDTQTFTFDVVPEPSTVALLAGAFAIGLTCLRRLRR